VRDVRMRGFRERVSVTDALSALASRTGALGVEAISIYDAAGRVSAREVVAEDNVPHFARAAMDGYALVGESTFGASAYAPVELTIVGDALPGRPFGKALGMGEAIRITTGAPLPEGADAVLMAENAEETTRHGRAKVLVRAPVSPAKHVGAIGEDIRAGSVVVKALRRLRPQDLGVLASVGVGAVDVIRRPRVRIVITGDELLRPGEKPTMSSIVDANSLMLAALARRDGAAEPKVVYARDRREEIRDAIAGASEDVVLISGGSSVGPEDHAPSVLAEIGEIVVHGVAMRPSSPAGFGFFGKNKSQIAFLLPGNPVSCLCAYEFFAGPVIRAMGGLSRTWPHRKKRCCVATRFVSELGRTDYVRVKVDGESVTPIMTSGASILSSTTRADGVVIIDEGEEGHAEGDWVTVFLYDEFE